MSRSKTPTRERTAGIDAQIRLLVYSLVTLVLLTGLAGITIVGVLQMSVTRTTETLVPALNANADVRHAAADADTAARSWTISGDESAQRSYAIAMDRLVAARAQLREVVPDSQPYLQELVEQQDRALQTWVDDYGDSRMRAKPGLARLDPAFETLGWGHMEQVQTANREFRRATIERLDATLQQTSSALPWVTAVMAAVALFGAAALSVGRRTARHISSPLEEMQTLVDAWARGQTELRAHPHGPVEVTNVARALNNFADENARVRELQQQVLAQLTAADRAKSEFIANVSHELRTPLTSIAGYLEVLADYIDPRQAHRLEIVDRNVARLRGLIEDLLALSSAETEGAELVLQDVDLTRLAGEASGDMRAEAGKRSVQITVTASEPMVVRGDPSQISRAVLNLVSNAIKFSPMGGEVEINIDRVGESIELSVVDSGMGVPADEVDRLGARFFRASNAVAAEIVGTGLGLRIVRAIMDNHAGRLEISSVEGRGTVSRLVFPAPVPTSDACATGLARVGAR